ncbi:hypothetical protein CBM2626_A10111 [Cupriavidus taiwanensis]|nr:hypothetical protein CBM2626_A10111 [Cupriavidus taiwanensis]
MPCWPAEAEASSLTSKCRTVRSEFFCMTQYQTCLLKQLSLTVSNVTNDTKASQQNSAPLRSYLLWTFTQHDDSRYICPHLCGRFDSNKSRHRFACIRCASRYEVNEPRYL